jgi:hypothetical protein
MNLEKEIWKDILGFERIYMVSSFGNVKSMDRKIEQIRADGSVRVRDFKGRIMKPVTNKLGYLMIMLTNGKKKNCSVHRLVAMAFIPKPDFKKEVNHKNGIKADNRINNLEWVTHSENMKHAHNTGLVINPGGLSKPISQFTNDGQWIRDWESIAQVHREKGFDMSAISNCINSKTKTQYGSIRTSYGFIWKHKKITNA